jgi:RND family efflux transporter MFP subunit
MKPPRSLDLALLTLLAALVVGCGQEVTADTAALPELISGGSTSMWRGTAGEQTAPAHDAAQGKDGTGAVPAGLPPLVVSSVLYSERDAEVAARVHGVLEAIYVELGDRVAAGQLLARLHDEEERANVEYARVAVDLAALEHERATRLAELQVIAPVEMEEAEYRLRAARARLQESEVRLEFTEVRAPFAAVVTRRYVREAQALERGDPLFRVTTLRPLRAVARVLELDAQALRPGQSVLLRGLDGRHGEGVIARIAPAVEAASGTIEVLIDVPDPAGLPPGAAVTAEFRAPMRP